MSDERNASRRQGIHVMVVAGDTTLIGEVRLHLEGSHIKLAGEALDGATCMARATALKPHIVIIADDIEDIPPYELSRQVTLQLPGTATIMLVRKDDKESRDKALASGARGVVPVPFGREKLIEAINRAYEYLGSQGSGFREESRDARGHIVVFYSAKGGVGKTVLASNLAAIIAQSRPDETVVLMDLNLQFGAIDIVLDIQPQRSLYGLLHILDDLTPRSINNTLCEKELNDGSKILVLAAPLESRQADEFTGQAINTILFALKTHYDFIIVDTPAPISDITLPALELADNILFVCTPDVLSIRQTRAALNFLEAPQFQIPRHSIRLVVNQVEPAGETKPEHIVQLFDYQVIGAIPKDVEAIQNCLLSGQTLAENPTSSPIVNAIRDVAGHLRLIPARERRAERARRRR